ncbi:hypothetical protein H0H87_004048 [Tephrocybe sp. NHM501043]|nr:hypothetical protein H0H87_004048 [Tephrocybe sp. NHM501043]
MHLPLSRLFLGLSVIRAASSLTIGYDKTQNLTASEAANKVRLDQAVYDVQNHIGPAVELYYTAFGQHANFTEVGMTIELLSIGILEAQVATHPIGPTSRIIGVIDWYKEGGKYYPSRAKFSYRFHGE